MQQRRMRKNVGRYRCFNKKLGGLRKKHPGEGLPLPGDGGGNTRARCPCVPGKPVCITFIMNLSNRPKKNLF